MSGDDAENLGPLAALVGTWEGDKGEDVSPAGDRSVGGNKYRERVVFADIGRVDNHEQVLYALSYETTAWRIGEPDPFHRELGYWLYEPKTREVTRAFVVPRGITVLACGTFAEGANVFELRAKLGSATHGICSGRFLDEHFRTTEYMLKVELHQDGSWSYFEDAVMQMPGRAEPFHHTDANRLRRV